MSLGWWFDLALGFKFKLHPNTQNSKENGKARSGQRQWLRAKSVGTVYFLNFEGKKAIVTKDLSGQRPIVDVLIPAFNEQNSVGKVVADIPSWVRKIVVVNNGSTDQTRQAAMQAGAIVVDEPVKGYGRACLTGMAEIAGQTPAPDILVFLDADYSDYPEQISRLTDPIINKGMDMVIGSRALGKRERGSMTFPQVFGNWLSTQLLRRIYHAEYSDLGPFRAIRWQRLMELNMEDQNYGWTIEMQIKAAKKGYFTCEVPVDYRNRIGVSKVSGTLRGVVGAGYKILWTLWKYR